MQTLMIKKLLGKHMKAQIKCAFMKEVMGANKNRNKMWNNNKDDFTPGQQSNIEITESLVSVCFVK